MRTLFLSEMIQVGGGLPGECTGAVLIGAIAGSATAGAVAVSPSLATGLPGALAVVGATVLGGAVGAFGASVACAVAASGGSSGGSGSYGYDESAGLNMNAP